VELTLTQSTGTPPQDPSTNVPHKFLPLSISKDDVWQDSIFREITEPVLIIQEYIRMLKKSSGRIIVVSGCSQGRFLCESIHRDQGDHAANHLTAGSGLNSILDDARRSIAHTFSCELEPFGIKVTSLVSGMLAIPIMPTQRILDEQHVPPHTCALVCAHKSSRNVCGKRADADILSGFGESTVAFQLVGY